MFGFLNIYKPQGKTSHDIVAILRRITKIKQIGHTGTLDPFAEGVLPICIGKSTRLIEYLKDDKAYIATVQLGKSTTTYDIEGEFVNISDKLTNISEIENILPMFRGEIEQLPPIYSAIKVNGKKLYDYARNNESVEIQSRKVTIEELSIINFDIEKQELKLFVKCSKGTYIRSIANDIGEKLGVYGYLTNLIRVQAGDFEVNGAIELEDISTIEDVKKHLIYPLEYLKHYHQYELNENEKEKISHGMSIKTDLPDGITILTHNKNIVAVADITDNIAKCQKVFI